MIVLCCSFVPDMSPYEYKDLLHASRMSGQLTALYCAGGQSINHFHTLLILYIFHYVLILVAVFHY
jgi:hypothetical protein